MFFLRRVRRFLSEPIAALNFVDKHRAFARGNRECFFLFSQYIDSKIIQFFTLHMDFPSSAGFAGKDGNHVALKGEVFDTHDFKIGDNPIYSLSRQGDIKPDDVFNYQCHCAEPI